MTETFETSRNRVAGFVIRCTQEQIDAIAKHHHETRDCVMHSVHVVLRTKRCNCQNCRA